MTWGRSWCSISGVKSSDDPPPRMSAWARPAGAAGGDEPLFSFHEFGIQGVRFLAWGRIQRPDQVMDGQRFIPGGPACFRSRLPSRRLSRGGFLAQAPEILHHRVLRVSDEPGQVFDDISL